MNQQEKTSIFARPAVVVALAILVNMLWGSAIPFINLGYRLFNITSDATATQILFAGIRFFLAGFLTILFTSIPQKKLMRPQRRNWYMVPAQSMLQTIIQYLFFYMGLARTPSVKSAIIQGLNAFVAILVACYLFRSEKMNRMKWIGGLLGIAGIVVVNLDGSSLGGGMTMAGEGFLIISMVTGACSSCVIQRFGQVENPVALSGWQFMFGGVVLAAFGFGFGGRLQLASAGGMLVLLYLACLSAVAYTLWSVLLKHNPVSGIAAYMFLQPAFGVVLSLLFYPETQVPLLRYGVSLVLVCLSIMTISKGQHEN